MDEQRPGQKPAIKKPSFLFLAGAGALGAVLVLIVMRLLGG